ncbi:hypothetical protein K490DRAFT_62304 [Saccharata proteae CBS 121410]|uniref:Uncharacterized protein n=1 Tax=Saccharata proteae CBS 121410 TaxID=1314787 RepID=A0A9P4LZ49_9PEZI|nr:hypothetical protein K490DRAFT_62304 [Saccharata proteae CBS 121410]
MFQGIKKKITADRKSRNNGQQSGRDSGNAHHCNECGRAMESACKDKGHVDWCEVPSCTKLFNARFGCATHGYSEAYNIGSRAAFSQKTIEEQLESYAFELQEGKLSQATTNAKIEGLRRRYNHEVEFNKKMKELPEEPKVSNKEQKRAKYLVGRLKKAKK